MNCKICGAETYEFDTAEILGKYAVHYYHCPKCDFVQTEDPYWLNEAYSAVFASIDTGTMSRNVENVTNLLFFMRYVGDGPCLDFGGGYGVLTRMMRDCGFDFYHYDKYAQNLFANGFGGDLNRKYTLVTAFENFEHFVTPLEEIENILNIAETVFLTTMLPPSTPPPLIKDWGYYVPDTGQHIAFYSKKTLEYIAEKFGIHFITDGYNTHILSKKKMDVNLFKKLWFYNRANNRVSVSRYFKKRTKTFDDAARNKSLIIKKNDE
jgi:hypothetical protein